jgi:hypothetical protein
MKTLLERLKPEYLTALELETEKYPNSMESLKHQLNINYIFTDLKLHDAYRLLLLIPNVPFGIIEIGNCFEE